jgi:TRAP-type C4-dicarboxylate transport system substrate-binding protein
MRKVNVLIMGGILYLGLIVAFIPSGVVQAKDEVINLKLANFFPPPAAQSKIGEEFIKDLEKRTDGHIKVQYFPGGSLLQASDMYAGVESGIADIGFSQVYYSTGRMPVTEAGGLPLGCPTGWVGTHMLNDFYFKVQPKEWEKVKLLWLSASSPNGVISKKPVRKLEDLNGLSLRAPGVIGEVVKALGGTPAPTPMSETYDAIAKGVVDGLYSNYEVLKTFRFAEVVGYMTVNWQLGNVVPFYMIMNKGRYEKLSPDLKEILDNLCGEYRERYALMWNEIELGGKNFAEKKGVTFIELSDAEAARWKKAVEPVIANYVKTMVGKGFAESEVNGWISFLRERIEYYSKKQIEYRIPSPAGPAEMRPENIGK